MIAKFLLSIALLSSAAAITPDQISSLTVRSPLPTGNDLEAVAASGNFVVAGGKEASIVFSRDRGLTWQLGAAIPPREGSFFPSDVTGLATSGTLTVAATRGGLFSSSDLQSWTPAGINASAVSYLPSANRFIAVNGSQVHLSADGTTWAVATGAPAAGYLATASGLGIHVASAVDGKLLRSTDGNTWTTELDGIPGRTGSENRFIALSFTGDLFIATGSDGLVYTSPDGTGWMQRPVPAALASADISSVARIGSFYAFASFPGTNLFITTDFISYDPIGLREFGFPIAISESSGTLTVVGRDGYIATSTDALTYTVRRESIGGAFNSVAFGAGAFATFDTSNRRILTSTFGVNWSPVHDVSSFTSAPTALLYQDGKFVALTSRRVAITSTDGITWSEEPTNLTFSPEFLSYTNNRWFATARNAQCAVSDDAFTWTPIDLGASAAGITYRQIAFGNGTYVLSGIDHRLLTSPDLITWTLRTPDATSNTSYPRIHFFDGRFIALSARSAPVLSVDGTTWTSAEDLNFRISGATGVDPELGLYVSSTSAQVLYLENLSPPIAPLIVSYPTQSFFSGIAEGNDSLVMVGDSGLLLSNTLEPTGYLGWARAAFTEAVPLTDREPEADPDRDGVLNLTEYVLDTNPIAPTNPLEITITGNTATWQQRPDLPDITTTYETSPDLTTWTPRIPVPGFSAPLPAGPHFYLRVRHTLISAQ